MHMYIWFDYALESYFSFSPSSFRHAIFFMIFFCISILLLLLLSMLLHCLKKAYTKYVLLLCTSTQDITKYNLPLNLVTKQYMSYFELRKQYSILCQPVLIFSIEY